MCDMADYVLVHEGRVLGVVCRCVCVCTTVLCREDAKKFKDAFEECQEKLGSAADEGDADLAAKMEKLEVEEERVEEEKVRPLSTV